MSEPKFTPGPWEWNGAYLSPSKDYASPDVIDPEVACMPHCYGGSVSLNISDANKALIAAAPAMYKALKTLLDDIERWEDAVATVLGREAGHGMDLQPGKAALALARGETDGAEP